MIRSPSSRRWLFVASLVAGLLALALPLLTPRQSISQPHLPAVRNPPAAPDNHEQTSAPKVSGTETKLEWPRWGGAHTSAFEDGRGFFDRARAESFNASVPPELQQYVIDLNARALLPDAGAGAAEILGENEDGPRIAYLQFGGALQDVQRAALDRTGVELLGYVDGYAWAARGTPAAFQSARELKFVRAIARRDARDLMSEAVYRVYPFRSWEEGGAMTRAPVPGYAQAPGGEARFMLQTTPGTKYDDVVAQLKARDALPGGLQLIEAPAIVLGPRFEIVTSAALAPEIASIDAAAYLGFVPPPAASRDATTDEQSNISDVRDNPPNLTGTGVTVAVREIGQPEAHADFASRLTIIDTGSTGSSDADHATGVAGQIGSNGVTQPTAKGVAPDAAMLSYALATSGPETFATTDIVDAAGRGVRISNHSYGPSGLSTFGEYDPISADWDGALRANNLVAMFAGNEEPGQTTNHIDFFVGCKNGICVGASSAAAHAGDVSSLTVPADGIADFSQFGPMKDGRVKPDLVAFGDGVKIDQGTSSVRTAFGTSFATPAVTGGAALVFQRYKAVLGSEPSAAMAKALLCNSATDLGNTGPDVKYGFGILNVENAITLIDLAGTAGGPLIEGTLNNGETQTFSVSVSSTPQLKITLCWMDPAGNPAAAAALVNNLDLELESPTGAIVFPFSIDKASPLNPAIATGPNTVDPIEQIRVDNPADGTWTIRVKGTQIPSGPQTFAICLNRPTQPAVIQAVINASPLSGSVPLPVNFSGMQSTGAIQAYVWDFGDGATAVGPVVSHTYTQTGIFTATLVVAGASNDFSTATVTITVGSLSIIASPSSGPAPLPVSFASSSQTAQVTYSWDFGDGTTGTGAAVEHTYTAPSTDAGYTVTLTARDPSGNETVSTTVIVVSRRNVDSFAGKARLKLTFGGNDDFQFSMIANDPINEPGYLWPRTAQQKRDALRDGEFEAKTYNIRIAGEKIADVIVDRRGLYKTRSVNFRLNLSRGEIQCKLKGFELASKLGITRQTNTPTVSVPVEIEASDVVYRTEFRLLYKSNGVTGSGKSF